VHKFPHHKSSDAIARNINDASAALPPNAVVSAYSPYVSHIDHRDRVYLWPTPFRAAYWATWKLEGQRLGFADQVQYLLLPAHLDSNSDRAVFDHIGAQYEVARRVGDVLLLKRRVAVPIAHPPLGSPGKSVKVRDRFT
jgi:hypothetical protein